MDYILVAHSLEQKKKIKLTIYGSYNYTHFVLWFKPQCDNYFFTFFSEIPCEVSKCAEINSLAEYAMKFTV